MDKRKDIIKFGKFHLRMVDVFGYDGFDLIMKNGMRVIRIKRVKTDAQARNAGL